MRNPRKTFAVVLQEDPYDRCYNCIKCTHHVFRLLGSERCIMY
jgi:hypothetical protein